MLRWQTPPGLKPVPPDPEGRTRRRRHWLRLNATHSTESIVKLSNIPHIRADDIETAIRVMLAGNNLPALNFGKQRLRNLARSLGESTINQINRWGSLRDEGKNKEIIDVEWIAWDGQAGLSTTVSLETHELADLRLSHIAHSVAQRATRVKVRVHDRHSYRWHSIYFYWTFPRPCGLTPADVKHSVGSQHSDLPW